MKQKIFFLSALCFVLAIACNKDDNTDPISTAAVNNTLSSGTWRITYYWDSDHEETSSFSGYSFTFGSGNVVTASKSGTNITGTWTTASDDSKTKLVLAFASPASFAELTDDWHVFERTDTKIRLQDVSGGSGNTDYLTFEKN
jgi:hypothetical protein